MKRVKVGKSKIHGNGLFANEPIKRGEVIELVHTMRELEPGLIKTTPTLIGRNYNHSDEPNSLNVTDGNNRYLVALKEIEAGGEITTNYRTNPDLEQPEDFTNDNYISFDYDDTLTTPEGFKLAQQMNKEGNNLYVITARDKITPQMIERAEAAGIPKENIIPAGSDQEKVRIIKENNITKHIDNKDSVIKALGDKGELFSPDAYPDFKADFVEMELSDDDLNKLREGGFIIDKYPNGGLVEVRGYEGNKFRKNANGKWEYESGRPVEDQLLIQKLTYESKPVGSPVVQGAPKVSLKPIPTRSENLKMISDLSMSPRIADQEKAAQLSELQREQDIFNPQEPDMIMKPKNMNDLKGYEFQVNRALGFPMDKAHFAAEAAAGDVNEEVDNFRHPLAGRYTTEAIRDYVADVPYERIPLVGGYVNDFMDQYIAPSLGFAGSNLLGASHEFMTLVNPGEDDRSLLTRLSESGEDLYNNYVGSKVGASNMTPEEKTNYLLYLSYNNKLPDGVVIEKDPKAKGPNNLYFKKGPNDPGRYKSSYANGGESKGRKKTKFQEGTYDPNETAGYMLDEQEVVVPGKATNWGKAAIDYRKKHSEEDFVNKKKKQYLKKNKGLNELYGVNMENFPQDVEQNFRNEYDYNKNTAVVKKVGRQEGWNPNRRTQYVDDLNDTQRGIVAESKYGSKLQPTYWDRTLAGLATLASKFSPELRDAMNKGYMPGLTKKESQEILNAKMKKIPFTNIDLPFEIPIGGLESLAFTEIPGAFPANYMKSRGLTTGSDYKEMPSWYNGEKMANVTDADVTAFNPLTYAGMEAIPELGVNAARSLYKGAKSGYNALKASKEAGNLSNLYKINPWALKENPNVLLHRVQKPGQTEQYIFEQFSKPDPNDFIASNQPGWGRAFSTDPSDMGYYTSGRIKKTRGYEGPSEILRLQVPKKELEKWTIADYNAQRLEQGLRPYVSYASDREFILPIDQIINAEKFTDADLDLLYDYARDFKNTKPHWLKGYPNNATSEIAESGTFKSGLGDMNMSRYEIKNPDYFTQLLNTYDSRRLSNSNKQFYKDLIANVKKQNGIATERQYNELQRLRTGNFNFGKKGYSNGGPINLFENQRPNSKLDKFIR